MYSWDLDLLCQTQPPVARANSTLVICPLRIYIHAVTRDNAPAPLTPAVLHILLALSTSPCHGYGIMQQVKADAGGKVSMGPGTLYGSLRRMIDAGLIRESEKRIDPELDDDRRIYYEITSLGQNALAAELQRYREVVAVAGRKRPSPKTLIHGS